MQPHHFLSKQRTSVASILGQSPPVLSPTATISSGGQASFTPHQLSGLGSEPEVIQMLIKEEPREVDLNDAPPLPMPLPLPPTRPLPLLPTKPQKSLPSSMCQQVLYKLKHTL